jgi:ubiquinone/menaquinone biosynthesis C-methylase UbiE
MINKYFFEVFENIPRQGPGSVKETHKAYSYLTNLPATPKILDVGCGKGIQTVELARLSKGQIVALDNHPALLKGLEQNLKTAGIKDNCILIKGDMFDMPFSEKEFDVIWSEGAIFIMGVEEGISRWKKFIKTNGYLVFTECCWIKDNPPSELIAFWNEEYPGMNTIDKNISIAEQNGFTAVHHFTLPVYTWKAEFYDFIEKKVEELNVKYDGNSEAMETFGHILNEVKVFDKYNEYFGYEFFVLRKQ